jgi:SAM-dependent methyltransferase
VSTPNLIAFWAERLSYSFAERGFAGTTRFIMRRIWRAFSPSAWSERRFDSTFGVSTSGRIGQYDLKVDEPALLAHAVEYRPTPVNDFVDILRGLGLDFRSWTFLDLGAGKGRALLLASLFPFAKVVGVEFAAELVEEARRNIAAFRNPRQVCRNLHVVCQDAAAYTLPAGNVLVYLNNPFHGPVMQRVVANIDASIRGSSRDLYVVYWNPFFSSAFDACSSLEVVRSGASYLVYQCAREFRCAGQPVPPVALEPGTWERMIRRTGHRGM